LREPRWRCLITPEETEQKLSKLAFLQRVVPFESLPREQLEGLAQGMEWREFRRGSLIIEQGKRGSSFFILCTGFVKVYLYEEERESLLGFLGEGDCFGEMSLLNREPTAANVEALEETVCLAQPEASFLPMVRSDPFFYRFFSQLLTRRMKSVYRECLSGNIGVNRIEPFLFRKRIAEMMPSGSSLSCDEQTSVREAGLRLINGNRSSLVVIDEKKFPKGIVGMRELLEGLLIRHVSPEENVGTLMSRQFGSIDGESYFFDAFHEMVQQKADRLVVLEHGKARGLLSGLDLLKFRGLETLSLLRNIDNSRSAAELSLCRKDVEEVLKGLMRDGALASEACRIVSELNDRIVKRVVKLAEEFCGEPPCSYAWLGLGSEGRKEQTLLTDQDNALIYRGPSSGRVEDYFSRFSDCVVQGLAEAGFPLCKGLVMATNQKYRGTLDVWKKKTSDWVLRSSFDSKEAMDAFVFLDFRSNAGDRELEKELRDHIFSLIGSHTLFIRALARYIVEVPIPLGFFKHFIVEKNGQHKNRVNIKTFGLVPLVTCLKLMAWQERVSETNTLARTSALASRAILSTDAAEFLEQAFETFLTLRIKNNLSDREQGREPSNYLDPALLSTKQKQLLKEAFLAVSELQKRTKEVLNIDDRSPMC